MHQPDQQGAPAKAVNMRVDSVPVRHRFAGVAVQVDVHRAVGVTVTVKMHPVAP